MNTQQNIALLYHFQRLLAEMVREENRKEWITSLIFQCVNKW